MAELKIKPCPFCGSKVTVENINLKDADEEMYMFECTNANCAAATCFGDYSTDRATANPKLEQACYKVHYKYKNRHLYDQYRFEVIK